MAHTSNYFRALVLAIFLACIISLTYANPELNSRKRREACMMPKDVDTGAAWDCRLPHTKGGENNCCDGYTCKCGRQLSWYGVPVSQCDCV